jgi:DNA repair protein SbcD/Mre11
MNDHIAKDTQSIKFAHLADCHLGGWRDQKLREIGLFYFTTAIQICIDQNVNFVIIAGDLFNTALPSFDILRETIAQFQKLKEHNIPIYYIAGSHDYSSAGKTMLHILDEAKLATNVYKPTITEDGKINLSPIITKEGIKLYGILGRSQSLEKKQFDILNRSALENEEGFKIFVFHTTIDELKPSGFEDILGTQLSYLPKGFDYYAGGHVHYRFNQEVTDYGRIVYPGPTFPNNFAELEELQSGSFVINTISQNTQNTQNNSNYDITSQTILLNDVPVESIKLECTNKTPDEITEELLSKIKPTTGIITIRLFGKIKTGSPNDINYAEITNTYNQAICILKNTTKLESEQMSDVRISYDEKIEEKIICEFFKIESEQKLAIELLQKLNFMKIDGEVVKDFEERIIEEAKHVFKN